MVVILSSQWWVVPTLLGEKTGLGLGYGVFGHYSNGVLLGILYAGIAPSLWGPNWLRPLTCMAAETVALMWFFMFPLLGAAIAGLKNGYYRTGWRTWSGACFLRFHLSF